MTLTTKNPRLRRRVRTWSASSSAASMRSDVFRLDDVDADRERGVDVFQPLADDDGPVVVQSHPVDDGPSAGRRNIRGRGLPSCGSAVTPPTSTCPKPSEPNTSGTSAFLSNPAATPTGLSNEQPNASGESLVSDGVAVGHHVGDTCAVDCL